jgi:hypothetical protein
MTLLEKSIYLISGIILLMVIGFVGASWWTSRVPSRPDVVHSDAVFLWAPAVGLPAPRRGSWLSCWEEGQHILCQLNNIDGTFEYRGEFTEYREKRLIPPGGLKIDSGRTRDDKVWVGDALVLLVYLQNGDILVPVAKYDESVRLLQGRGRTR